MLNICLGVELYDNNTKLLMSSDGSKKLATWDLTSNPENYSFYSMGEYSLSGVRGKRIGGIINTGANQWEIYSSKTNGAVHLNLSLSGVASALTAAFTSLHTYTSALTFNSGILLGSTFLLQSTDTAPAPIYNLNTNLSLVSTDTANFLGGPGFAFYSNNAGVVTLKKKFLGTGVMIRGAQFVISGANEYLYTVAGGGRIDVFDVTDMNNISRVKSGQLSSFEGEAYAIKINADSSLGLVVTNRGDFLAINPIGIAKTTTQYTIDP